LKYLLRNKNNAQNPHFRFAMRRDLPDIHYYYGHYYAAQVMWTAGGKYWSEWYPFIRDELLERAGSSGKDGAWEDQIDSHYATATPGPLAGIGKGWSIELGGSKPDHVRAGDLISLRRAGASLPSLRNAPQVILPNGDCIPGKLEEISQDRLRIEADLGISQSF